MAGASPIPGIGAAFESVDKLVKAFSELKVCVSPFLPSRFSSPPILALRLPPLLLLDSGVNVMRYWQDNQEHAESLLERGNHLLSTIALLFKFSGSRASGLKSDDPRTDIFLSQLAVLTRSESQFRVK